MYKLNEVGNERNLIGEKAYNLYLIQKNELARIPQSWVIGSDDFQRILAFHRVDNLLQMEKEDFFVRIQRIKEDIELFECDKKLREQLQVLSESFCDKPMAVRSSFSFEDNSYRSNAGMFHSSVDNYGFDQIWYAVLQTWKSAFLPLVRDTCSTDGIGVLIQPYIFGKISGIAFSQGQDFSNNILICYQDGNLETMTAGVSSGKELRCHKDSIDEIREKSLRKVAEAILRLEKFFGYPVDVEWLIDSEGELYILQCRPINQVKKPSVTKEFEILNVDKWREQEYFSLEGVSKLHVHWCTKKHWVRKHAIKNGFGVSEVYYVHIPEEGLNQEQCETVLEKFSTEWIEICADTIPRKMLLKTNFQNIVKDLRGITVRFESVIVTYNAGIASYDDKNGVVITDMVPGSINGIREGNVDPSHAVIMSEGIELTLKEHMEIKRLDTTCGCWRAVSGELLPLKIIMDEKDYREIERLSKSFYLSFGQTRVEWIHNGTQIYFFDISFENTKQTQMSKDARWISYGLADAPILKLENIVPLHELWDGHVSVWRPKEFYDIAKKIDLTKLAPDYIYNEIKPIIVTEAPITHLALLVSHAAGFIFQKGSVLSHFAIILRENGVPAIFQDNCMSELNTNDWLRIE